MEYLLLLTEDPELVATDGQRARAVERVGEYASALVADGVLRGGAQLRPVAEARRLQTRNGDERVGDRASPRRLRPGSHARPERGGASVPGPRSRVARRARPRGGIRVSRPIGTTDEEERLILCPAPRGQ
jgi:hypothetical protein